MPPTVSDEFSLIYQNLLLAATLVQALILGCHLALWHGLSHVFYASDEYTAFTFNIIYFIAKATPSDSGVFLVVSPWLLYYVLALETSNLLVLQLYCIREWGELFFTCTNCIDYSTAIVFRMTWFFTNHNVAIITAVDERELWLPVHL